MKNKILAICLISTVNFSSYAAEVQEINSDREENMQILEAMGLPRFGGGIKVVPRSQLGLPKKVLEYGAKEFKQRKTLGYVEKNVPYASKLLTMEKVAPIDIKQYATNNNEQGTHLRKSVRNLKLAFNFKGVESDDLLLYENNNIKVIGIAPQGAFNKESGGWSGAVQFFSVKNIGVCSYGVMNVKASGTSTMLAMEDVTYEIHDKATLTKVEGSKNSGFIYKVKWYDDVNFHELECANSNFTPQMEQDVIGLAKGIDRV